MGHIYAAHMQNAYKVWACVALLWQNPGIPGCIYLFPCLLTLFDLIQSAMHHGHNS